MTRTAVITGASGFIGGRVARRLLDAGWTVHAVVREGSPVPEGAVPVVHTGSASSLVAQIAGLDIDVTFHLASLYLAEHNPGNLDDLINSNVLFSAQVAEAVVQAGCRRFINTGTAWQNYRGERYLPVNFYAATKQAFQDLLIYYHDALGLSCITLKLFDTFGPGDPRRKLIQILIDAIHSRQHLDMSPGEQVVDLTHVDDVVDALMAAADRLLLTSGPVWETYLLSGERYRVRDLASYVSEAIGLPLQVNFGGRPYRAREVMEPPVADVLLPSWSATRPLADYLATLREP